MRLCSAAQQPYSNIHIDGLMNAASNDVVMVHASQVPYDVLDVLKKKGYKILEAPSTTEVRESFGCNFVALEPGLIVMPEGNPRCQSLLEDNGIKVIQFCFHLVVSASVAAASRGNNHSFSVHPHCICTFKHAVSVDSSSQTRQRSRKL